MNVNKENIIGISGTYLLKVPYLSARIWAVKISDGPETAANVLLEGLNYVSKHSNEIEVVNLSEDVTLP